MDGQAKERPTFTLYRKIIYYNFHNIYTEFGIPFSVNCCVEYVLIVSESERSPISKSTEISLSISIALQRVIS